jgi:hypothetical protein
MLQVHAALGSPARPPPQRQLGRPICMSPHRRPFSAGATVIPGQEPAAAATSDGDQHQPDAAAHNPSLLLVTGAALLPHPDKAYRGGEDWYFIAGHQQAFGVADGVGGWAEVGVDAGAYARSIMGHAKQQAEALAAAAGAAAGSLCSQAILEHAYVRVDAQGGSRQAARRACLPACLPALSPPSASQPASQPTRRPPAQAPPRRACWWCRAPRCTPPTWAIAASSWCATARWCSSARSSSTASTSPTSSARWAP